MFSTSKNVRVALVIGDGVAEGIGDQFSYAGLSQRLQKLFDGPRHDTKLSQTWHVFTAGRLYSTSKDWLPGGKLLENALIHGPYARAGIVAYVVGSHEDARDGKNGADNVARTAEAAARLGKHIVVCAFPNFAEPGTNEHVRNRERTKLLHEALVAAKERLEGCDGAGTITWDVNIDKVLMRRGDVIRVENNFTTLNAFGYRAFARELFDELALAAKKVEWAYWKSVLNK